MKLPTLDEMIGLDKFNLTESQKHDCRSLANHRGFDAAIEQAKKISSNSMLSADADSDRKAAEHTEGTLKANGFKLNIH